MASLASFLAPAPSTGGLARAVLRARAFQFLVVAALLYRVAPAASPDEDVVRITPAELQSRELRARRAAGGAPLSPEQAASVRAEAIEDALLEREARRLGLADDDLVVRRRLVQKSLFLAEDLGGAFREQPEEELRDFHRRHADAFRLPGRVRLVHVFATDEAKLAAARADFERWTPARPADAPPFGDPFPFARAVDDAVDVLESRYGKDFATAVAKSGIGAVTGPVPSKFGTHLVKVLWRDEGRPSRFEEVKSAVAFAALVDRRERAIDDFVRRAFARTRVEVAGERVTALPRVRRLAMRDEGSAEDGL